MKRISDVEIQIKRATIENVYFSSGDYDVTEWDKLVAQAQLESCEEQRKEEMRELFEEIEEKVLIFKEEKGQPYIFASGYVAAKNYQSLKACFGGKE